uniref:Uncharacterized protein n=1 Tax=Rhizophora mucronata TaxID=61149 RepID=A0A2P2PHJ0_RHIMU
MSSQLRQSTLNVSLIGATVFHNKQLSLTGRIKDK